MFSTKRWYIEWNDERGELIFGPFDESELSIRLNDYVAAWMRETGTVRSVQLSDRKASKIHINAREHWMHQQTLFEMINAEDLPDGPVDSER